MRICKYCGKEILGRSSRAIYCSVECNRIADKERKKEKHRAENNLSVGQECVVCGKKIFNRRAGTKLCSIACRAQYYSDSCEGHGELIKNCSVCGKEFKTYRSRKTTCSDKCRAFKHNKPRRYKGITIDSDISLFKLANRDNNQCQLCGLLVNWDDKKVVNGHTICGNMYPSIDHITPISLGGLHSWDNVQLAHRSCNSRKQNRFIG